MRSFRSVPFFVIFVGCLLAAHAGWCADPGYLDYKETVLGNGLRVITLEDFSCPIVSVNIWYHVGSKDEDPDRQGFAHMFEHMMFRGTDKLGPTSHFDLVRRVGGRCNGYTSFDQTVYFESVPANQLDLALWLEAERMSFLKIDQAAFDTERKVVEEERRLRLNAPYGTLEEEGLEAIFKTHPYRWTPIGKIPHLRASSVPELRAFWTSHYTPNNATLVIVGAVKHGDAQALAKKYFEWMPRCPDPPRVTVREPFPEQARTVTFRQDKAPAPLAGLVYRTVSVASDDRPALEVLGNILGSGDSSRVYKRIVGQGLGVQASEMGINLEQDGVWGVGAALQIGSKKFDEVLAALEDEVNSIRTKPVADRELTKAKNQMMRGLVTESLYIGSKASALGEAAVLEGDAARVNRRLEEIRIVTAEKLLQVAQKYLDPQRVLRAKVEANLGGMFSKKKSAEDEAPITAQPETNAPAPGRPGLTRPADYPVAPPSSGMLDYDPTPRFQQQTIKNGLKVVVITNHEVPFVSVQLGLRMGAFAETKPGVANMAMYMLTKGGAGKRSAAELAEELDTYAISLGGGTGMDSASVWAGCLTEQLERAVQLMGDVVMKPRFDGGEFEKRRKEQITSLTVQENEPSYVASREFEQRLYGEHPYARAVTGRVKDVEAISNKDMKRWWKRFVRPDMGVLYFSGDIELEQAARLAEETFGSWKVRGKKPETLLPPVPPAQPTHIYLVDRPGDQSQIRLGQLAIKRDDPRYFTSRVVSGYFGGAFGSRLNDTLRVKKGFTYGAGGGYSASRFAGNFSLGTFSKLESTAKAVQACLDEIKRLQDEPPAEKEIGETKSYILGSFPADHETPQQVLGDLWFIESNDLPADYFQRLLAGVASSTPDGCASLAKTTLDPGKLVIVVTGPADKLKKDLEAIAPVTVVENKK